MEHLSSDESGTAGTDTGETTANSSNATTATSPSSPGSSENVLPGKRKRPKSSGHRRVGRAAKEHRERQKRSKSEGDNVGDMELQEDNSAIALPDTPAPTSQKRPYVKRKKQVLLKKKKKKERKDKVDNDQGSQDRGQSPFSTESSKDQQETSGSAENSAESVDTGNTSHESQDADIESGSNADSKRRYQKKRKFITMPRKARKSHVSDDEHGLVEVREGDDHAEYEYVHSDVQTGSDEFHLSPPVDLLLSHFISESEAIDFLTSDLSKSLADTNYIVDVSNNVCRLSMLGPTPNVYVMKSISWSKDQGLRVFVHNQRLTSKSVVCLPNEDMNMDSILSVSEHIMRVANLLSMASVCEGITEYQQFWCEEITHAHGKIETEYYEGADCYRDSECELAIFGDRICKKCKLIKEKFRKRQWYRDQAKTKGKSVKSIAHAYMSRKELEEKLQERKKQTKAQAQKIKRLNKRIEKMIEKDSVPVDHILGQDFFKILKANVDKMTDIQKLFWNQQVKALSRQHNPRSMRWSPMMIKIALHLQMLSPASLQYWKESGLIFLPSERRLYDFTHFTEAKEGIQNHIIDSIKKKVDPANNPEEYFNLLFDEMTIRSDIVLSRKGEILGCTNMDSVETSVANLEAQLSESKFEREPAKKVLVYMLQRITNNEGENNIQEIVAIFATGDLTAEQLYTRTWDVIYNCEAKSIKILCLVCDGAPCNKKFFRMNVPWDPKSKFSYATRNIASGENRPLFFKLMLLIS